MKVWEYLVGYNINDILVDQRSELERHILQKLKSAHIEAGYIRSPKWMKMKEGIMKWLIKLLSKSPKTFGNDEIAAWVQEVVDFVESEEYLALAKRLAENKN